MEIRQSGGMTQRPVAVTAIDGIGRFDNRRQPDLQRRRSGPWRQQGRADHCLQFEPAGEQARGDLWRSGKNAFPVAPTVAGKGESRPLTLWREVEFMVDGIASDGDESLETTVFPEFIGRTGFRWRRNQQAGHVAAQAVRQFETPCRTTCRVHLDRSHLPGGRRRMAQEVQGEFAGEHGSGSRTATASVENGLKHSPWPDAMRLPTPGPVAIG